MRTIAKKTMALLMATAMIFAGLAGVLQTEVYADSDDITVYVTISERGETAVRDGKVMARVPVQVDADATVADVLEEFHEEYYPGGYEFNGYVTKLWGAESGNFLFFINNRALTSGVETESVSAGARITASVNADDRYYSDYYGYFNTTIKTVAVGSSLTLTAKGYAGMSSIDATAPIEGLQVGLVTADGFAPIEGAVTASDGTVTIDLNDEQFKQGETYYFSAKGTVATTATDWSAEGTPQVDVNAPVIAPICKVTIASKIEAGVKNTSITNLKVTASKGAMTLRWGKSAGFKVDGYQVYKSTKKTVGTYKKAATVKTKKATVKKNLKKGTRYYYKVRGYRVVQGKTVYTKWSEIKSAKAK